MRMHRAERRRRKECARPGVNVATLNIEPYSLSMWRLVVVRVVKSMERNGEKKCDEKIEPSMAPFWGWRYLLQHSHHLSLCVFHHCWPTVLFPDSPPHRGISEVYVSVFPLSARAELHYAWAIYTILCVLHSSCITRPYINPSVHAVLTRCGRAISWMVALSKLRWCVCLSSCCFSREGRFSNFSLF